jgi:predicted lipid-binding transport protein (Tim44 family)
MERSVTQPSAPQPGYGAQQGFGGLAPRPSFMSGLMGGLIGAGIGGMLFGGGMFGGISGIGSVLGLLLQIGLAFLVVRLIMGFFAQRRPAMAGGPQMFTPTGVNPQGMNPQGMNPQGMNPQGSAGGGLPPITISPADFAAFERLLQQVQAAWSQHDLGTMSRITTPEMNSYFAEQLADQASRNIRNQVSAVKLEQGDLSEAWTEQGRDYATVAMRFSMIDVTVAPNGKVVDGHPSERTMTTEIWTFLRARGGDWVLSAIQQVR